ncbi:unnamed protein product [Microthlaspi erraticum]|uniref:SWIM-type domain-containing protein n=1 Tax=Microthlaspi erraticum TaxID=1685480 RepID=A0A6D2K629_9BRAS|nr:unnamed protein product [Microthlaspi erraticum]
MDAELPKAEHRMCARHIYANWKKQGFSRSEYKNLFWGVAYSYTEGEYDENMEKVKAYDPSAYDALLVTEPHRWCSAFFSEESHCADVHNNLSESFNRTIKIARSMPVINMLEEVRRQAMRRVSRRFLKAERCDTIVTPITMRLLEKSRLAAAYCSTTRSSKSLYEVREYNDSYAVNISTHQCACRKWDLTGIPCKHAICVLDDNQDDPVRYVPNYYYASVMKKTYDDNIKPVNGEKMWKRTHKPPVGIPEMRKQRGRPKNRDRRKEPFEDLQNAGKSTRHGRIPHCSRCKEAGHIKSGCKNEEVVFYGPKNRRGRPRKFPSDDTPKPPSKPRKRKAPNNASSSQPLPVAASGEAEVSSSAPQPSVSTKQVKPHVKKAARGKQLKVKKTIPVPYGVGTFWSPYTNRPFEVFGDRVHDRSGFDQQPPQEPTLQPQQAPNMQSPQDPSLQPTEDGNT